MFGIVGVLRHTTSFATDEADVSGANSTDEGQNNCFTRRTDFAIGNISVLSHCILFDARYHHHGAPMPVHIATEQLLKTACPRDFPLPVPNHVMLIPCCVQDVQCHPVRLTHGGWLVRGTDCTSETEPKPATLLSMPAVGRYMRYYTAFTRHRSDLPNKKSPFQSMTHPFPSQWKL